MLVYVGLKCCRFWCEFTVENANVRRKNYLLYLKSTFIADVEFPIHQWEKSTINLQHKFKCCRFQIQFPCGFWVAFFPQHVDEISQNRSLLLLYSTADCKPVTYHHRVWYLGCSAINCKLETYIHTWIAQNVNGVPGRDNWDRCSLT